MQSLTIDDRNWLAYEHHAPYDDAAPTFVFINALTGKLADWEAVVAPRLREAGFGTLSWNFRGQADSPFGPGMDLTEQVIEDDLRRIVDHCGPAKPVLVGLSIGGLYAAKAIRDGLPAAGLVLLNTLREIGPRIGWINDALPKLVAYGGVPLFADALFPLLVNPEFAAKVRPDFLKGDYQPLAPDHGHMNLIRNSTATDWSFDWSSLSLPVLVVTGLHDRVFLDRDVVERLYATIPEARREEWQDAGHLLPQERPEKLAESLARFGREIAP